MFGPPIPGSLGRPEPGSLRPPAGCLAVRSIEGFGLGWRAPTRVSEAAAGANCSTSMRLVASPFSGARFPPIKLACAQAIAGTHGTACRATPRPVARKHVGPRAASLRTRLDIRFPVQGTLDVRSQPQSLGGALFPPSALVQLRCLPVGCSSFVEGSATYEYTYSGTLMLERVFVPTRSPPACCNTCSGISRCHWQHRQRRLAARLSRPSLGPRNGGV